MNGWSIIYRCSCILLGILVVLTGICLAVPKFRHYQDLESRKETLEQGNQQAEETVHELQSNQEQFRSDDAFLIDTARGAGMVQSNELVYKFTNVPSTVRNP